MKFMLSIIADRKTFFVFYSVFGVQSHESFVGRDAPARRMLGNTAARRRASRPAVFFSPRAISSDGRAIDS